jgi:hypothetical protein
MEGIPVIDWKKQARDLAVIFVLALLAGWLLFSAGHSSDLFVSNPVPSDPYFGMNYPEVLQFFNVSSTVNISKIEVCLHDNTGGTPSLYLTLNNHSGNYTTDTWNLPGTLGDICNNFTFPSTTILEADSDYNAYDVVFHSGSGSYSDGSYWVKQSGWDSAIAGGDFCIPGYGSGYSCDSSNAHNKGIYLKIWADAFAEEPTSTTTSILFTTSTTSSTTTTTTIAADAIPPVVSLTCDADFSNITASDNENLTEIWLFSNVPIWRSFEQYNDTPVNASVWSIPTWITANGTYIMQSVARDATGNNGTSANCTFSIGATTTTAPASVTVVNIPGLGWITVFFIALCFFVFFGGLR